MVKAVFIDFYGTLVQENTEVISELTKRIYNSGEAVKPSEIGIYWWKFFQDSVNKSYGENFITQRELERIALKETLLKFKSTENLEKLSELMFSQWLKPPVFDDTKEFFEKCLVPVYIVSNVDRNDIIQAVEYHDFKPAGIVTSEDARSYKPRTEIYNLALSEAGLNSNEVVHIGDSLTSDVKGARDAGINTIWLNRTDREVPSGVVAVKNLLQVFDTEFFE
ncbi:MAG: HAD family hydrolase [Acutalibacteraceae bacterium]|nr:HAD family hydrolase [Acutalibacteraceae bacterium]